MYLLSWNQAYLSNLLLYINEDRTHLSNLVSYIYEENQTSYLKNRVYLSYLLYPIKTMIFKCELCSSTFTVKSSLEKHINSIHKKIRYNCDHCDKSYTQRQNLTFHVLKVHKGVRYNCNHCNSVFKQKIGLKKHTISKHLPITSE